MSVNRYGDQFRLYCVVCEEVYSTGVQHGDMRYNLTPGEISDLITCVEAKDNQFEANDAAFHDYSTADKKRHRLMVHGLRKKLKQILKNKEK